jgi:hypothetical protein
MADISVPSLTALCASVLTVQSLPIAGFQRVLTSAA